MKVAATTTPATCSRWISSETVTRIPLIVVSRYTHAGHISHTYSDHVSILKFIERNWRLQPVSERSRDNLPNPRTAQDNPYFR